MGRFQDKICFPIALYCLARITAWPGTSSLSELDLCQGFERYFFLSFLLAVRKIAFVNFLFQGSLQLVGQLSLKENGPHYLKDRYVLVSSYKTNKGSNLPSNVGIDQYHEHLIM